MHVLMISWCSTHWSTGSNSSILRLSTFSLHRPIHSSGTPPAWQQVSLKWRRTISKKISINHQLQSLFIPYISFLYKDSIDFLLFYRIILPGPVVLFVSCSSSCIVESLVSGIQVIGLLSIVRRCELYKRKNTSRDW